MPRECQLGADPRRPLPLNHLPSENRGTAGRIGEVRLIYFGISSVSRRTANCYRLRLSSSSALELMRLGVEQYPEMLGKRRYRKGLSEHRQRGLKFFDSVRIAGDQHAPQARPDLAEPG